MSQAGVWKGDAALQDDELERRVLHEMPRPGMTGQAADFLADQEICVQIQGRLQLLQWT
jgi:hypothetical protein